MKRISVVRAILYSCMYVLFFIVNFFIRPYPTHLTALGINADVDEDAVLAAFMINVFLLLAASAILLYTVLQKRNKDFFLILFIVLNVFTVVYWFSYM